MNNSSDWIPVGALGDAFASDSNALPAVDDLAGRSLELHDADGGRLQLDFLDSARLRTTAGEQPYRATRPRPGIYFVDFLPADRHGASVSLVLDLERGVFLGVFGQLPSAQDIARTPAARIAAGLELTAVAAEFRRGTIGAPPRADAPLPAVTDELIGQRIEYTYSPSERYEHVYLNPKLYTWHCLDGVERGLADTDACHYYKLGERLYLFVWREKIIPTLGIVVVDLVAAKTTGKILGYEGNDCAAVRNFPVGAFAKVVGVLNRR